MSNSVYSPRPVFLLVSLSVAVLGLIRPQPARAEAKGALVTAKTVEVKEKWWTAAKPGDPLKLQCNITVKVARPDKVRVTILPADDPTKTVFYVADGSAVEHEFNGYTGMVSDLEATPEAHAHAALRGLSAVDLLLAPDPNAKPEDGTTREISREMLDGRKTVLRTDHRSLQAGKRTIGVIDKIWFDAATGFPYRRSEYMTINGKTDCVNQLDFADWKLNKPIPAAVFAFTPPAGSKPFPKLLAAGATAPDFAATTPDGKTVHLSDYKGKIVVLDFWATWCGPCQESMPHLDKVYQSVKDKDVVVLAVCVWDKKPEYDKWVSKYLGTKYHFPVAFDPAASSEKPNIAGSLYNVTSIPTQYLINKDGTVAAVTTGYGEGDHRLEENLHRLGIESTPTSPSHP